MTITRPLTEERELLRTAMHRIMNEEQDLDFICKHLPRMVLASANVARIQNVLEANDNAATDILLKALAELAEEEDANNDDDDDTSPDEIDW